PSGGRRPQNHRLGTRRPGRRPGMARPQSRPARPRTRRRCGGTPPELPDAAGPNMSSHVVLTTRTPIGRQPMGASRHRGGGVMAERKRLSDILLNGERDRLEKAWSTTKAADDLKPLPSGEYRCRIARGELFKARGGTPGYKLTLEVLDGE